MSELYLPLPSKPGVQRDGTSADSPFYVDAQHNRFYQNKPKKMGGYRLLGDGNTNIIRSLLEIIKPDGSLDVYLGRWNKLSYINVPQTIAESLGEGESEDGLLGVGGVEVDRTPIDLIPNENGVWSLVLLTAVDEEETFSAIVAAYLPEGLNLSSNIEGNIYIGLTDDITPLTKLIDTSTSQEQVTSGGIVSVKPFLMKYGNNGVIRFSQTDNPYLWPDDNFVIAANSKILAVRPLLAGANPAALAWSNNSLARLVYDPSVQNFSTSVEESVSLLSPNCIVKVNSNYFWIGKDQFYFFNGVTQKLANDMNSEYFFNSYNKDHVSKIWGYYNNKYNEIHFSFPKGTNTEASHEIIINLTTQSWYDNALERAAGIGTDVYPYPIMTASTKETLDANFGNYGIWMHEYGVDKDINGLKYAIPAWCRSSYVSFTKINPENNFQLRTRRVLPDFVQSGDMTLEIFNYGFPSQKVPEISRAYKFGPETRKIDVSTQGMYSSYKFMSNEVGGDYLMGDVIINATKGDTRPL